MGWPDDGCEADVCEGVGWEIVGCEDVCCEACGSALDDSVARGCEVTTCDGLCCKSCGGDVRLRTIVASGNDGCVVIVSCIDVDEVFGD